MSSKAAGISALKSAQKSLRVATKAMNVLVKKDEAMEGGKKRRAKKTGTKKGGKKSKK